MALKDFRIWIFSFSFGITLLFLFLQMDSAHSKEILKMEALNANLNQAKCMKSQSCSLKAFGINVEDYRVLVKGRYYYGVRANIFYETESPETLEDYVVVNYKKGCRFNSTLEKNGTVSHQIIGTPSFGDYIPEKFSNWVIDSDDIDPAFGSMENARHGAWKWNPEGRTFDNHSYVWYLHQKPNDPFIWKNRTPGQSQVRKSQGSSVIDRAEMQSSVKYKTCIYRSSVVSDWGTKNSLYLTPPIACLEWNDSFQYNFDTGKWESPQEIISFCTK